MNTRIPTVLAALTLITTLAGAAFALDGGDSAVDDNPSLSDLTERSEVTTVTSTSAGEDVSGPCDEAEHADDPRCAGVSVATGAADASGEDVSGPCDEAEHADDPRCTGSTGDDATVGDDREDNSGSGSIDDDDDPNDDNSGSGSGSDD
jgi:hypothetical protein